MHYVVRTTLVEIDGDEEQDIASCDSEEFRNLLAASEEFEELTDMAVADCMVGDDDEEEEEDEAAAG